MYKVLKDFEGSNNKVVYEQFKKGTVVDLTDELAAEALKAGHVSKMGGKAAKKTKKKKTK